MLLHWIGCKSKQSGVTKPGGLKLSYFRMWCHRLIFGSYFHLGKLEEGVDYLEKQEDVRSVAIEMEFVSFTFNQLHLDVEPWKLVLRGNRETPTLSITYKGYLKAIDMLQ
ncbi:hypothetical protein AKJ16_DCAP02277 [Drosera capensis]